MEASGDLLRQPRVSGRVDDCVSGRGLVAGDARPEEDEKIEFRLVKLNEVLKMIDKGEIKDGKTLTSVLLYSRKTRRKGKK